MKLFAIITAGGIGTRMGSTLPKQFLKLNGKPVLMHTIQKFYDFSEEVNIILTLPESYLSLWETLCQTYNFNIKHTIVIGGATRFESIKNALKTILENGKALVAVHDGARPLVSKELISNCFNTAIECKTAVLVIKLTDTLREHNGKTLQRENYRLAQTPQVFDLKLLQKAYQQPYSNLFTDDASVVESMGITTKEVEGEVNNIKITTPLDMYIAEKISKTTNV